MRKPESRSSGTAYLMAKAVILDSVAAAHLLADLDDPAEGVFVSAGLDTYECVAQACQHGATVFATVREADVNALGFDCTHVGDNSSGADAAAFSEVAGKDLVKADRTLVNFDAQVLGQLDERAARD